MRVTRNPDKEKIILDALRESFDELREGIHLSDLLTTRRSYLSRIMPMPLTHSEILYFLAGRGHEEVFARLVGVNVGASEVKTVKVPGFVAGEQRFKHGISYRPDFRWDLKPTEFKTRRANLAKPGEEPLVYDGYLEQLKGYCALDEQPEAVLPVFSLLEGRSGDPLNPTHPELAIYDVLFSPGDLSHMLGVLLERKRLFEAALALGTVAAAQTLPLCDAWKCGKNRKVVERPAWCVQCAKELQEPWATKHTKTKTGEGHTVTPEVVRWEYEPRCKWYTFSRPQLVDVLRGSR